MAASNHQLAFVAVQIHRICWRSPYHFHRVSPPAYLRTRAGCTSKSQVWIEVPEHVVENASARVCVVVHGDGLMRVYGRYTAVTCRAPHGLLFGTGGCEKKPPTPLPPCSMLGWHADPGPLHKCFCPSVLANIENGGKGRWHLVPRLSCNNGLLFRTTRSGDVCKKGLLFRTGAPTQKRFRGHLASWTRKEELGQMNSSSKACTWIQPACHTRAS